MKKGIVAAVLLSWILSVAGSYWLGHHISNLDASSVNVSLNVPHTPSTLGEGSRAKEKASQPGEGSETSAASGKFDVTAWASELRGMMRNGSMMNMSAMGKIFAMVERLPADQIEAAAKELEGKASNPQETMMIVGVLGSKWAQTDGPAAMAWVQKLAKENGPMGMGMTAGVVSSWAQSDPEAVWKWYQEQEKDSLSPMGSSNMALPGLFAALADKDVESAFNRLGQLESDMERNMAVQGLSQLVWNPEKRDEVLDSVLGLEDESLRKQAMQSLTSMWAMIDSEGASDWVESLEPDDKSEMSQHIAHSLMMNDPERGATMLLENAESAQDRRQAYASAVSIWASRDPNAAGEWLSQQEQGPELDQARMGFAMQVVRVDPESAMAWASAVSEDNQRQQAVRQVYMQWQSRDQEAAVQGLAESGLPADVIERIQSEANPKAVPQ